MGLLLLSICFSVCLLLLLLFVYFHFRKIRQVDEILVELQEKFIKMEKQLRPDSATTSRNTGDVSPRMLVTIEVKDPIGLARRESYIGKIASDWLPDLVKQKVYEQVRKETIEELKRKNVDAKVNIIQI